METMTRRRASRAAVIVALSMWPAVGEAQKTPPATAAIVGTSARPILTVARLLVEDIRPRAAERSRSG